VQNFSDLLISLSRSLMSVPSSSFRVTMLFLPRLCFLLMVLRPLLFFSAFNYSCSLYSVVADFPFQTLSESFAVLSIFDMLHIYSTSLNLPLLLSELPCCDGELLLSWWFVFTSGLNCSFHDNSSKIIIACVKVACPV